MNMKKSGIYEIKNLVNGKRYIGQSHDIVYRLKKHFSNLKYGRHHNKHLMDAWNKYGVDNFESNILEECPAGLLDIREQLWISYYKSNNRDFGYNCDSGGNTGRVCSEDTRKKMSASGFRRPPVSFETRAKLSIASKGYIHSEESKAHMSAGQKGKFFSPETRAKMSAAKKGRVLSDETRAKMSESGKGRFQSDEAREKQSQALKLGWITRRAKKEKAV